MNTQSSVVGAKTEGSYSAVTSIPQILTWRWREPPTMEDSKDELDHTHSPTNKSVCLPIINNYYTYSYADFEFPVWNVHMYKVSKECALELNIRIQSYSTIQIRKHANAKFKEKRMICVIFES